MDILEGQYNNRVEKQMDIGLLGISYRSSDLALRERFARVCQQQLQGQFSHPFVLLSTCNRTEIYFSSEDLIQTYSDLLCLLDEVLDQDYRSRLYCYFGQKCFTHLAKVTAGADSAIFGEAEIQRQVKQAYGEAGVEKKLSFALHYLFQKSLKIGKQIRTEFPLVEERASIEHALWDLIQCFFSHKKIGPILFVGYSEINRKVMRFFQGKGICDLYLITKSVTAAQEMQNKWGVSAVAWEKISTWVDFSMVICGTKSSQYLLKSEHVLEASFPVKSRLVVDLSLPRTVDPFIAKSPLISLFNIEEIEKFIDQKYNKSLIEQKKIEQKIEELAIQQVSIFQRKKVFTCA